MPSTTVVVAVAVQVPIDTVTVYVPALAAEEEEMEGFCNVEEKPAGPAHEYLTEADESVAVNNMVMPSQAGVLLVSDGVGT